MVRRAWKSGLFCDVALLPYEANQGQRPSVGFRYRLLLLGKSACDCLLAAGLVRSTSRLTSVRPSIGTFASVIASGPEVATPSHGPDGPDTALGATVGNKVLEDTSLQTQQHLEALEQAEKVIQEELEKKLHQEAVKKNATSKSVLPPQPVQRADSQQKSSN